MGNGRTALEVDRSLHTCCVVVGPDAVSRRRVESPDVPIVALVDAASPIQAVLAQAAGADIVLPSSELEVGSLDDTPGLAVAVRAAEVLANRRRALAVSSRTVCHDLAGSLNVIGLAAELGAQGSTPPETAFAHINTLAREAATDAWRAGRFDRSSRRTLAAINVGRLVRGRCTDGDDIEVRTPERDAWVVADEQKLSGAVAELVHNARRAGATQIQVAVEHAGHSGAHVEVLVSDNGPGFSPEPLQSFGEPHIAPASSGRLGLGLATIAEFVNELGGSLGVVDTAAVDTAAVDTSLGTTIRLSLPAANSSADDLGNHEMAVDQAATQADILERVVRAAPLPESLEAIVAAIENQLPGATCSVLLLTDGQHLHHGAGASLPAAYRSAIDGVKIGLRQGSCGTAAFTGRPVIASDVTNDDNWVAFRSVATEHGLRSCWSTPIVAEEDGAVLGTFAVYRSTVWEPSSAAIKLVKRFTYLAAVAIEHHRLFEALAESESRFRSAFEGATAGMALVRLDGSLLKINRSLSRMLNRPESELLSSNLLDVIDVGSHRDIRADWKNLAQQHEVQANTSASNTSASNTVRLACGAQDEEVWVSLNASIVAAAGERYFYVEVRDISASRRHEAEQRAREAAEAANRAKTDVLALVSHELRTPLNAILGFAQVLQLVDLDAGERADSVDQIVRAGEHLRDLIEELLDLSRIEAGQLSVELTDVATERAVGDAVALVNPLASARSIRLSADATPFMVRADQRCMRQVLINLLGNAVKYTPVGGQIEVATTAVGESVRLTVTDTGPGIPPESLGELFQPFHRLTTADHDGSEGTGLGLSLAARLMEEMGGTIGLDSAVGVGSRFWVEFPRA